jgi:phosphate starvation-inducible membrane PsiE
VQQKPSLSVGLKQGLPVANFLLVVRLVKANALSATMAIFRSRYLVLSCFFLYLELPCRLTEYFEAAQAHFVRSYQVHFLFL